MIAYIPNVIFALVFIGAIWFFTKNVKNIARNIKMGKDQEINDNKKLRWQTMFLVAIGQSKMVKRPVAGLLHIFVYVGFIIVNIEMLEIIIDGLTGTHRVFHVIGPVYSYLIAAFEFFALAVILACVTFLFRRNVLKINRFTSAEMTKWPKLDGNLILVFEIVLMSAFLFMNASDSVLQTRGAEHYHTVGSFPISGLLIPLIGGLSDGTLMFIERFSWWFHIVGVLIFLNYIPYSKHFHVFLAFPNTYFSKLKPRAQMDNMESVSNEVKIMLGTMEPPEEEGEMQAFGAKDVTDLTWKNLMDAYTCTECGRCTAVCPANLTGKKLSPRKIMMDTRDRIEDLAKAKAEKGPDHHDGKNLLGDYISHEEIWACTTCNACTEECPVNIDQVSIITQLRRYVVMEEASSPAALNAMFTNIENNGAPWKYSAADRFNWANDLEMNAKS